MKYGIREICDVVLKAKSTVTVGNKEFKKGEPVIYFDSLKTSTMEGAATTVYAQGGRGNSRLVAWEGERTVTFTMEDALISELGLAVLTGAGIIDGKENELIVHTTAKAAIENGVASLNIDEALCDDENAEIYAIAMDEYDNVLETKKVDSLEYTNAIDGAKSVLFDFYVRKAGGKQIEITADKFAGNYYLEASTLFRSADGVDHPAEFIIPNCKIQSNFTFTMASSGDPSTFTFTMDAFPDYIKFDYTKKVLSVIQVIDEEDAPLIDKEGATAPKAIYIAGDATAAAGDKVQLRAAVEPYGANSIVDWKVTTGKATVNANGVVSIAKDATGSITVTAASAVDATKTTTHTITIG